MKTRETLVYSKLPFDFAKPLVQKLIILGFGVILFLPWISFTVGQGQITAINPNERVQSISASVSGFVKRWHVKEGDRVIEGDVLVDLVDNDPDFLERLD